MKTKILMTGTVLGLSLFPLSAAAFDELHWDWGKTVNEEVNIIVEINSDLNPSGHVEIQQTQIFNGDIRAEASFEGFYLSGNNGNGAPPLNGDNGFTAFALDNNNNNNLNDLIQGNIATLNAATELGTLVGNATAIANYHDLRTETATFLHYNQIHNADNANGYGVEALAVAGRDSPVAAAVNLNATAISNYLNIQGSPAPGDNILIADITQSTNANLHAYAHAVQDLSGYNNIGNFNGIGGAGVVSNLSATAIGNYSAVSFGPSVTINGQ